MSGAISSGTTGGATGVGGRVAPGFEAVAEVLARGATVRVGDHERTVDLGSGGGAFAAYADGELVVDVWVGEAAPDMAWQEETRAVIMSATKGLSALCAHILADRGVLDPDAPVTEYWPEFGAAGKSGTLVRHLLSHQAGAIGVPDADRILSWDGTGWDDAVRIAAAVASAPPAWEPGTRHGYHGLTFGWLVGELVRRVSGLSLGTFFRREVAEPLGADCAIGTPAPDVERVARVIEWTPRQSSSRSPARPLDPASLAGQSVLAGRHGHLFADANGQPRFADFINNPAVLGCEVGAIAGTATARGLARVYGAVVGGEELVSARSVRAFSQEQVCGPDAVMVAPSRWALGYTREPPSMIPGLPRQHGPNDQSFGHMGAGGQVAFGDPVAGVGCAFLRNHLEYQALP
ncbi:MAG TPA: serine hydrolase domain-containing protein, partial [Acidimicrobiales bacterium]|nr:serine hydrolase domain-containing protein [Acidimicrobiales bacterium]